ncbi:MAG: tRNA (adenosine(37)-N6)-threonylcarbamoyltransferase complex dimerization subunit type 1 TsaB [Clostridia bacterium]|nr:tRNA (adenosine(37)-N6)-threonylcarbamoyltransferase complex dimerization subunit type 1 TsaB [Clostridia bacterium]
MKILAMDTSSVNATVAVCDENKILGEYTIAGDRAHSQIIMPMLEELLKKCSLDIDDIDVFAVALGPGSFTGLRIGIAAMKTFASTLNKKIIGISSLDVVAANFFACDKYICPIFDARRSDVYNAVYKDGKKISDDRICDIDTVLCEMSDKKVIFAGDGVIKYREKIQEANNPNWYIAPCNLSHQSASSLASIALFKGKNNEFDSFDSVLPIYIRPSQAEREYMDMHGVDHI